MFYDTHYSQKLFKWKYERFARMTDSDVHHVQEIVLDCPPGRLRPDDLLEMALRDTGLTTVEASTKLFGEWTFDFAHVPAEQWSACRPTLEANITRLFREGYIRYGSW